MVWTLVTSAAKWHLYLASRTLLKMCVELRFSCPTHPYTLLKMYILKEIIRVVIFRNCLFKFHQFNAFSTSGSRKRLVASMDLRIALNLEPPKAVLLKRYGHLLQAARGECGGNQRTNYIKICVESCFEICCELVVNAVQKNASSARFTSSLVENSIWELSCTTKRELISHF